MLGAKGAVAGPPPGFSLLVTSDEVSPGQADDARNQLLSNTQWARENGVPTLTWGDRKERLRPMVIVGGGPSLKETLPELREWAEKGDVFAVNDAHDWLIERGIVPKMFAMQEIDPWPYDFVTKVNDETTYYIASIAHRSAFERLLGRKLVIFHTYCGIGETDLLRDIGAGGHPIIAGAEAMAVRAINLGWALGYTDFHMFGVDGCYREGEQTHIYLDRKREAMKVYAAGREFLAPYYLARQADDLRRFIGNCGHLFTLTTHGDGLVQHVHRTMAPERYAN